MPPCTPCTKKKKVCNNEEPCDQCLQLRITCFHGRTPGKKNIRRSDDDDFLRSKRLDPLDYSGISSEARVKLMNRLKKEDEAELKCGKTERERQKPLVWDRTREVLKQQACVKAWMKPLQDQFSNSPDNKHIVWLCCHPKLFYEMYKLKKKDQPKFSGIGYTEDAEVSRQVMALEMDRRSRATRSSGQRWGILVELRLSDKGRDFWHQQVQQQPFFDGVLHNVVSGKKGGLTAQGLIRALEFYESRSKLPFPELPSDFDKPSYYIGDLKDDISDDEDAMHVDEAETAGPSVLNVRQPRIRSLDDNSIEGDTFSSKAKGKQRAMSREARERAETSPMETGSEDASSTQSEGGWIMEVSVDEDVIGVTEDQDVVTELLGFVDSDVGRSRWLIHNFAFDIEGETLRKKYGVAQGDRTSKAVMDALALWKRPFHATACIFPNRPDDNSLRFGYSELDNLADHVAFIEACEHLAYVEDEPKGWALLWCLPLRTQKERTRARTQAREEALEKLGRINWDENADDPSKPIICMDLHKSIQDWERVHEKIDMQRCQEFNDRFGQITAENLSLWRGGKSALDAPKKYPLYLITYPDVKDQKEGITGGKDQKEGITDDPFLRDKVRYIRKHWDEENWKISRTLVDNREQALQRMDMVDSGKWQATLPYYCTEDLWRAITDIEIEKLDLGNKITRDMIENMEYSESGDQGEGDDDDNGDSGA